MRRRETALPRPGRDPWRASSSRPLVAAGLILLTLALPVLARVPDAVETSGTGPDPLPPVDSVRQVRKARILAGQGQTEQAIALLRETIATAPDPLAAQASLLRVMHSVQGMDETELEQLETAFLTRLADRQSPLATAELAYLSTSPNLDSRALEGLRRRLQTERASGEIEPERLEILADIQRRQGETTAALETLESLWDLNHEPRLAWKIYTLAVHDERWQLAADHLGILVEGGAVGLRPNLVQILARAGRYEATIEQIGLVPVGEGMGALLSPVLESLAWSLYDSGQKSEARKLFERAAEAEGDLAGLQTKLQYLFDEAPPAAGGPVTTVADGAGEDDPHALFEQGTQKLTLGDAEAALGLLERAAAGLPGIEAVWYNLGLAAYRLERWEKTAEAFGQAIGLNPRRVESHLYRGVALVELERCAEAVSSLENVVSLDPSQSLAYYHLATCYRGLGELEAADFNWRRYQESRGDG